MSLKVVYGPSVSGKTEQIYDYLITESIAHPEREYMILVPEQASLTVQQELVLRHPRHALFNIDVMTFNRLAYRVLNDVNDAGKNVLGDSGKLMLLRLVMKRVEGSLTSLKRNLHKPGFLDEMKSVISELAEYNISPEMLRENTAKLQAHPMLQAKLQDIGLIYAEFTELLHRNYEMTEERAVRLAKCLHRWQPAKDTVVALDGFTGFTPPQYEVLSALLMHCPEVILGATVGSGSTPEENRTEDALFYMSANMITETEHLSMDPGFRTERIPVSDTLPYTPEILHMERFLFRYPREDYEADTDRIRILKAKDPKQEVEAVVSEILKAVRAGVEFREMAVIAGSPEGYRSEIEAQFQDAGIPYFMDAAVPLSGDPLFLLIGTVLDAAEDFSFDNVMNYAKNPLAVRAAEASLKASDDVLSAYERICEFENFALARGMRGKKAFSSAWEGGYRGFSESRLEAVNETREAVITPLLTTADAVAGAGKTVEMRLAALSELLAELNAQETMTTLSEEAESAEKAREYLKSYELLEKLFTEIREILGGQELKYEEFREVLRTGMASLTLGLVPPTKDRLVVGDLKRTRLGKIRKLFVIGANEGLLPARPQEDGLLSDLDREILKENAIALSPTARQETFDLRFYLYLLFTKPSETLMMTYAQSSADGKALAPSYLIGMIRELFSLQIETVPDTLTARVNTAGQGLTLLADGLRTFREQETDDMPADLKTLCAWYASQPHFTEALSALADGLFYAYQDEVLPQALSDRIFRDLVKGSVTRLEKYAGCAYAHFLTYGLGLSERQEYAIESKDLGNLFHESIDTFFRKIRERGEDWYALTDEERTALVRDSVQEVTGKYGNDILKDSARNEYLVNRVQRLTERTLTTLKKQWDAGGFTSTESEVAFPAAGTIDAIRLPLENGMQLALEGRIDRMDLAEEDGRVYVKIIDYKSGKKELDYTRMYYGLQLQLLLYMEAAKEIASGRNPGKEVVPAGIYYYHIDDPLVEAADEKHAEEAIAKELQLSGITNSDDTALRLIDQNIDTDPTVVKGLKKKKDGEFYTGAAVAEAAEMNRLGAFTLKKAQALADEMVSGHIEVSPYAYGQESSCTYCAFRGVCGFDDRIEGYHKRKLRKKELQDLTGE